MREIKFRGKSIHTFSKGKWVYGYLVELVEKERLFIGQWKAIGGDATIKDELFQSYIPVDPETVGQYTGLKDKGGQEIYEGDIVRFSDNPIHEGTITVCEWLDWRVGFVYKFISGDYKGKCTDMADTWRKYEVIGNIHDNPELLEVEP